MTTTMMIATTTTSHMMMTTQMIKTTAMTTTMTSVATISAIITVATMTGMTTTTKKELPHFPMIFQSIYLWLKKIMAGSKVFGDILFLYWHRTKIIFSEPLTSFNSLFFFNSEWFNELFSFSFSFFSRLQKLNELKERPPSFFKESYGNGRVILK